MELSCREVRDLMAQAALSDERAEQIAEHLDGCADCDAQLSKRVGEALSTFRVSGRPSLDAVRSLSRARKAALLRFAAVAAAVLVVLGTAWALLRPGPPQIATKTPAPIDTPLPEPPRITELTELDRNVIRCEGVLALYLQFCLTCINDPTQADKEEYLTRSLLIFREVRGRLREQLAAGATTETVTLNALNDALQMLATSKLPSVKNAPSKALTFKFLSTGEWEVGHLLGSKTWRLTLPPLPASHNFTYLKLALGANDALMNRLEEALWVHNYVKLPAKLDEKDPSIGPKALETVLPLLSPRQQAIYRKIVGSP